MEITTKVVSKLCKSQPLALGIQLESNRRAIVFDCSDFDEQISSITIVHQRHDDVAPYIAAYSANERTCTWIITATDTSFFGYGKLEVRIAFTNDLGNGLGKTITIPTMVIKSITADAVIPSALQSWYDAMIDYIDENAVTLDEVDQLVQDYLDTHPIQVPVTSVNGQTGAVTLTASDVGALSSSTTFVSSFNGSSGAVTYTAPVTSVNTKTGAVSLSASDVGALPDTYTAPVSSVNGRTGAVTGLAEAWTIENKTSADTSVTLTTGKFYIFPEMSTLTVTVTNTGMYAFRFTSGTTATTLTVNGATMPDSFTVEASKVYEVNVYQGYAVVSSWTAS